MSAHSIIIDSNNNMNNNFDKLYNVDFHAPAKIFRNKHAVHQFENVTPDVSIPGTPLLTPNNKYEYGSDTSSVGFPSPSLPPTAVHTPPSLSPQHSDSGNKASSTHGSNDSSVSNSTTSVPHSASVTSLPSRPTTPSQFVFKKPQYNKEYHHTHFHHLEKKETILHDLKKFFKSDKSKKKEKSLKKSTTSPSIKSTSEISFANEFNRDLEGKYGKWGKFVKREKYLKLIRVLTKIFSLNRQICW